MSHLFYVLLLMSPVGCLAKTIGMDAYGMLEAEKTAEAEDRVNDTSGYEIYLIEAANAVVIDAKDSTHVSELQNSINVMDLYFSTQRNFVFSSDPHFRLWDTETGIEQDVREFLLGLLMER